MNITEHDQKIHIVGGIYNEICLNPIWRETFGSAGRAAQAMSDMGIQPILHGYSTVETSSIVESRAQFGNYSFQPTLTSKVPRFAYVHGLSTPEFSLPDECYPKLEVKANLVVRFGIVEPGEAVVHGNYVVYDPQNSYSPSLFSTNGSTAKHLAIVLNRNELHLLTSGRAENIEDSVRELVALTKAEVVVVKQGPKGAIVYESGSFVAIPAFQTNSVWKIGSGDNFVAHFAMNWMLKKVSAGEAAMQASLATAFYCEYQGFAAPGSLAQFKPQQVLLSPRYINGYQPVIYLAGPFFTMAERWLIGQARDCLIHMGMRVFSPYHDVGHGSADEVVKKDLEGIDAADVIFAVGDGLDSGTIFEIGYARARGKPVVLYSENESDEDKKMMEGSSCIICKDFVSAIYRTVWTGVSI